jgi:protein-S-isoprenylcysteine O-methyltransferase Ste14
MEVVYPNDDPFALAACLMLAVWMLAEFAIHSLGMRQAKGARREWPSSIGIVVSFVIVAVFSTLDAVWFHVTTLDPQHVAPRAVGLALLLLGAGLRVVTRLYLGRQFSGFVQTSESHTLVTTGIYHYLRHPAYSGSLLIVFGFPLALGSLGALACSVLFGVPAIVYRIYIEEQALLRWFGDDYAAYRTRTRRILPGLW